ncbi:MAG: radical SAM protein [Spirochaetales bacterium]|nr:radical SAM protein [Spirochaetales bacterium]
MKKPDILFINPNLLDPPVAPLGIEMTGSYLRSRGMTVELLDLNKRNHDMPEIPIKACFSQIDPLLVGISIRNLDDSSYPSMKFTLKETKNIVEIVKKYTSRPCVLGGVGFSLMPEAVLKACGASYGITGDGEEPLFRLLTAIKNGILYPQGNLFPAIPGLSFVKDGSIHTVPPDFGRIPSYTSRGLIDNTWYFTRGGQIGIETKRGCDGSCIYCADPVAKGRKIRLRPPGDIVAEIAGLADDGITCFHTCDCEFNRPPEHAAAICDALIRSGLSGQIGLYAYCSPSPFPAGLYDKMAAAGFKGINFGVDHMNDGILEKLGRDHTARDVLDVTDALKQRGMRIMYDLLLCSPFETESTLTEAIEKTRAAGADCIGIGMGVRLYPGTPLYRSLKREDSEYLDGEREEPPLRPLFYVRPKKETAIPLLCSLIGSDRRFFFQPLGEKHNYNYADNNRLLEAIEKGARGAYWDILSSL